jgi:pimeloyl-ACP methyl ester carboxylesterase
MCLHDICPLKCGFGYHTSIPVLAFYGELDKNVDPMQGAQAYKYAQEALGNEAFRIEIIEGAGHTLARGQTRCPDEFVSGEYGPEYLEIMGKWIIDRYFR